MVRFLGKDPHRMQLARIGLQPLQVKSNCERERRLVLINAWA